MAKIKLEDVQAAVAYLESTGSRVSVVSVRNILKRGSATTITKLLRDVRQTKATTEGLPTPLDTEGVPPEVVEKIAEVAKSAAIHAFRVMAEPINQAIARVRQSTEAERKSLLQDIAQVSADAADAADRLDAARTELDEMIRSDATSAAALAAAQEQLRVSEAHWTAERRRHEDELIRLREQVAAEQAAAKQERERFETAMNEASELRGRLAAYAERIVTLAVSPAGINPA